MARPSQHPRVQHVWQRAPALSLAATFVVMATFGTPGGSDQPNIPKDYQANTVLGAVDSEFAAVIAALGDWLAGPVEAGNLQTAASSAPTSP